MNSNTKQWSSENGNDKKRLSQHQVELLEASFYANKKLEPERKIQLAHELGVPPRQVAIWYQNKRARWKNQSMEQEYSTVSRELETTLAQVRQLEQELHGLRVEMHNSQAEMSMLHATNYNPSNQQVQHYNYVQQPHDHHHHLQPPPPPPPHCDEGGSSSFHDDHDPMTNYSALISDQYYDDDDQEDLIVDHDLFAFLWAAPISGPNYILDAFIILFPVL